MKYLLFCIPLLFISCGENSNSSESSADLMYDKTTMSWEYKMVIVSGSNPKCPDPSHCTTLRFEYPVFSGEGSERANLNVGHFLSERLGLVVDGEKDLLNAEKMMASYFEFWEAQRDIDAWKIGRASCRERV